MEAVAAGFSASIVGIVILAILLGAINGSVFWAIRNGLLMGAAASIIILLVLTVFMAGVSSLGVTLWSLPSLLLAFLVSYMVALKVKINIKLKAIWCSVIAFFMTLVAGIPYILTFRVNIFAPIVVAIIAGIFIFNPAMRSQKWLHQ